MSECLQAVVAAALAVQASAPIVLNRHLHWKFHMLTCHQPDNYLAWLFCSRSLISLLSTAWHLTQLHFYLRQRTDEKTMAARADLQDMPFPKADLTIVCWWFKHINLERTAITSTLFQTGSGTNCPDCAHTYKRPGFIGKPKSRQGHKSGCTTTTIWHVHNWRIRSHNTKRYAAILSHGENMPQ